MIVPVVNDTAAGRHTDVAFLFHFISFQSSISKINTKLVSIKFVVSFIMTDQ